MALQLEPEKLEALRAGLRGPLLLPDDDGYDEARSVWNGMIDRNPALVVQATGNADVIAAVNFARDAGLAVSVKGGGHSVAGKAVADDALLIDLSLMNSVHVDPSARLARAQGGATWGIFDRECQVYGLASTGGVISTTGVGGLTLGGGLGYLMGKHGLSIDNMVSADVVTADGQVLRASESENADLFWALRGGSGNFGIVTSFEFRVHPVGPMITGGIAAWPLAMGRDVTAFYRRTNRLRTRGFDHLPRLRRRTGRQRQLLAIMIPVHTGSLEDGAKAVQPIKEFGPPIMDVLGPIPYQVQQSMLDAGFAAGQNVYWKSTFLTGLSAEAIEVIVSKAEEMPVPTCNLVLEHFHGAVRRVPRDATAFQERDAAYNIAIVGVWQDPKDEEACIAWARGVYDDLQPFSTGSVYVNYLGVGDEDERVEAAYGGNFERLAQIKQKYDPGNLFRVNQNIRPRA